MDRDGNERKGGRCYFGKRTKAEEERGTTHRVIVHPVEAIGVVSNVGHRDDQHIAHGWDTCAIVIPMADEQ